MDETGETINSPVKRFLPFMEKTPLGDDKVLHLEFLDNATTRTAKDLNLLKQQTGEALKDGFQYVSSVLGIDFPFLTKTRSINLTSGDYARCRAQGQAMNLPIEFIRELAAGPKSEQGITKQSLIAHEILHELTDDEDLPMFLEMIYVIEHGVISRISQIKSFLTKGELTPSHIQGLKKIASYLKYPSPEEMLDALPNLSCADLKEEFKKQVGLYCAQEFGNSS